MTLDELDQLYQTAFERLLNASLETRRREAISAVVRALRPALAGAWLSGHGTEYIFEPRTARETALAIADRTINEILGDEPGPAAGGDACADGVEPIGSEATPAAPSCEWTSDETSGFKHLGWNHAHGWTRGPRHMRKKCHHCGKPISFKEQSR
jgi:hypothetical protein